MPRGAKGRRFSAFWGGYLPMAETTKRADRQDIARRVERGEKLLQKGKAGEALEEFLQTLALDPGNDVVRQMTADHVIPRVQCQGLQKIFNRKSTRLNSSH